MFLIQSLRQRSIASEIKSIKEGIPLQVSNSLLTLHPVLTGGLLRVGRCLANAQLSAIQKHPLILHGKYVLAQLIIFRRGKPSQILSDQKTLLEQVIISKKCTRF